MERSRGRAGIVVNGRGKLQVTTPAQSTDSATRTYMFRILSSVRSIFTYLTIA